MTATLRPYGLTTEQLTEPLGVGEPRPRLSWRLECDRRGAAQGAYRITAADRHNDLDDPTRLLWDTGRRESGDTLLVPWDGPMLRSATRYHWRVEVWDETGAHAGMGESWFETGLLHREDWTAVWVGRDPHAQPPLDPPDDQHDASVGSPPLCLRREFTVDRPPVRARLYATARGSYEPRLNGLRVGDAELAPGWTEYRRRLQYQTYDVTAFLRNGTNVLGAVVADGWWCGYIGFDPRRAAQHYGDCPAFLAQLVVDYADGSRRVVATDAGWTERPGATRSADLLMGQYIDAREHVPGWDASGPAAGFRPVAVLDAEPGPLVAEPDHPVRVTLDLPAVTVHRRGPDRFIVDFGQNMVGRVRLTVRRAAPGRRIVLRHAEMLAGGELYLDNLRRAMATDVYLTGGAETEVFEPRFTVHGFRYVEIDNYPGELSGTDVVARVLHNATPWTGRFDCSDPMVNRLQANITWSQRGNFVAVPTDCPQRDERLGWLADAQVFAPTASRNADVSAFFARWLRDVVDGQGDDGAFRDVAPVIPALRQEAAPAWGDAGAIIPWQLWRTYGDRRVLERCFDAMVAWVAHIRRNNPDLRWRYRTGNAYGDWLQVDADTPREVLATAYFARSAQLVAAAADVLGRHDVATQHRFLHAAVRSVFIESYVDDDGTVMGDTQTGYLLAVAFGLLPEDLVAKAVDHLAADIEKRDYRLTTGFVGTALLCPVLADHGRADLAYALLQQEEFPSWGYSIRHGATTIWERWDGWTDHGGFQAAAMNSFNHYSLGSVGDWLFGRVAGIDQTPTSVAYRELLLRPLPGGTLSWARAEQETARGKVACGWSVADGRITVTATVPPGSTAFLEIPTPDPDSVRESDALASSRPGVLAVEPTSTGTTLRLASGHYIVSAVAPSLQETP